MKTRIVQNEPDGRAAADQSATESGPVDDQAGSSSPTGWTRFRGFVRRYELVIFFALTYLIAWSSPSLRACQDWLGLVDESFVGG